MKHLILILLLPAVLKAQDTHKFVKTGSTFTYQLNNTAVIPYGRVISAYVSPDSTRLRIFLSINQFIQIPSTDTIKIAGATVTGNLHTRRAALMSNVFPVLNMPSSTKVPVYNTDLDGNKDIVDLDKKSDTALLKRQIDSLSGMVNMLITDSMQVFQLAGPRVRQKVKVLPFTATPNTGNGFSVDISAVGFSTILSATVSIEKSTADIASIPIVSIKSASSSAIVVNIYQPTLVVLGGLPNVFTTNFTGIKLHYTIIGY